MFLRGTGEFIGKCTFHDINGPHKEIIQLETVFNYTFNTGHPGKCPYKSIKHPTTDCHF